MTPSMIEKLKKSLTIHEGYKNFPYVDTVGKITIGIGYNLTDRGLDNQWIDDQFLKDVNYFYEQLSQYDWFNRLNDDRKIVLIDMAFMGLKKLLGFSRMIEDLNQQDYLLASMEMMNSNWANQVGKRAKDLANAMATGVYTV